MKLALAIALISVVAWQDKDPTVASPAAEANGPSRSPSISEDGDIVVFESKASNLVSDDTDGEWDVFAHSRKQHRTRRISGNNALAARNPTVSGDGHWVAYLELQPRQESDVRVYWRVVLNDLGTGMSRTIDARSPPKYTAEPPRAPSLSHDGRWLAYVSKDAKYGSVSLAYVFDRELDKTEVVSISTLGTHPNRDVIEPSISSNGRFVVFSTDSLALTLPPPGPFDIGNDHRHIFVRDRAAKTTRIASDLALRQIAYTDFHDPLITPDGRHVAYNQHDTRYGYSPEIGFVSDLTDERPGRILPGSNDKPQGAALVTWMSSDGRRVLVESDIGDMASLPKGPPCVQMYERDIEHDTWKLLSRSQSGAVGDGPSRGGVVSSDLGVIAFWSSASNLVEGDGNGWSDIFVLDKATGRIERISVAATK